MKYIGALSRTYRNFEPATLWESYCPEDDRPGIVAYGCKITRPNFVGWSALGPIAMLIENILGVDLDMDHEALTWHIRLTEEHGIRNLPLGDGGRIDLKCERRASAGEKAIVSLTSDTAFRVILCRGSLSREVISEPGGSTVKIEI